MASHDPDTMETLEAVPASPATPPHLKAAYLSGILCILALSLLARLTGNQPERTETRLHWLKVAYPRMLAMSGERLACSNKDGIVQVFALSEGVFRPWKTIEVKDNVLGLHIPPAGFRLACLVNNNDFATLRLYGAKGVIETLYFETRLDSALWFDSPGRSPVLVTGGSSAGLHIVRLSLPPKVILRRRDIFPYAPVNNATTQAVRSSFPLVCRNEERSFLYVFDRSRGLRLLADTARSRVFSTAIIVECIDGPHVFARVVGSQDTAAQPLNEGLLKVRLERSRALHLEHADFQPTEYLCPLGSLSAGPWVYRNHLIVCRKANDGRTSLLALDPSGPLDCHELRGIDCETLAFCRTDTGLGIVSGSRFTFLPFDRTLPPVGTRLETSPGIEPSVCANRSIVAVSARDGVLVVPTIDGPPATQP